MDPGLMLEKAKQLLVKGKPSVISNVLLKVTDWILQLMQSLTPRIPSKGEATNQMDQRNVCVAVKAPHIHMKAALPGTPSATDVAR